MKCPYCVNGVQEHSVCHGIGPTRFYEIVELPCWDCDGTGEAAEPTVFHGWTQAMLDSTLGDK